MDNWNLYKKIYDVMNESEAIEKTMTVGSGNNSYKAVSEAAMLNLVKPLFKKHRLIVFPVDGTIKDNVMVWEKTDSFKGTVKNDLRAITELKVVYKIVDIDSGESELLVGFGNGADPQDKGAGKSFTYSYKTMLSKTFMLFSGEDTDNTHSDDINKDTDKAHLKPPSGTKPTGNTIISQAMVQAIVDAGIKRKTSLATIKKTILTEYKKSSIESLTLEEYNAIKTRLEK